MDLPAFLKPLLLDLLRIEDAFPSHTVHEMIWGYPDELVKLAYDNGLAPFPEFGVFVNVSNRNTVHFLMCLLCFGPLNVMVFGADIGQCHLPNHRTLK